MNAELARAIIAQAKSDESYEGPMPEDDEKAIAEAQNLVEMAQTAWAQNVRGSEVESLLRLAASAEDGEEIEQPQEEKVLAGVGGGDLPEAPEATADPLPEGPDPLVDIDLVKEEPWVGYAEEKVASIIEALDVGLDADEDPAGLLAHVWAYETAHKNRVRIIKRLEEIADEREMIVSVDAEEPEPEPTPEDPQESTNGLHAPTQDAQEGEIDYSDLVAEVEEQLAKERLHVPEPPVEDPPKLPYDYSKITDAELRSLHSIFSAFAYRANYLLMRDERVAASAKMQADEIAREILVAIAKYDEKGHEKKVSLLDAEVEATPKVKELRRIQRKHEIFATAHRQERDSYHKLVESMSRLESMRMNEYERSRR